MADLKVQEVATGDICALENRRFEIGDTVLIWKSRRLKNNMQLRANWMSMLFTINDQSCFFVKDGKNLLLLVILRPLAREARKKLQLRVNATDSADKILGMW